MQEKYDLFGCVVLVPNSHSGEGGDVSGVLVIIKWGAVSGDGCGVVRKLRLHGGLLEMWNCNVVECGSDVKGRYGYRNVSVPKSSLVVARQVLDL